MADDGYEYLVGIKDELTAQTNAMVRGLTELQLAFDKTSKASHRAEDALRAAGHAAHDGAHKAASGISYLVRGFDDLSRGGRYAANGILDVGKAATRLGPLLLGVGVAALTGVAISMGEFRRETEETYAAMGGGEERGRAVFSFLNDAAREVHMPAEKAHELAKSLMEEGMQSLQVVTDTVRAVSDLHRVGLDKGAEKLQSIISRSLATGTFTLGKGGRALAGTGVDENVLAAQLGLSRKKFELELKQGKISAEEGIEAINQVILQGKLGALATKKFTISDAVTDLHNTVRSLLQETDASPITEALERVTSSFKDGTEAASGMKEMFDTIITAVAGLIDTAKDIGVAFGQAWGAAKEAASDAVEFMIRHDPRLTEAERAKKIADIHYGEHMMAINKLEKQRQDAYKHLQELANAGLGAHDLAREAKKLGVEITLVDRPKEGDEKALQKFREQVADFSGRSGGGVAPLHDMRTHARKEMHAVGVQGAQGLKEGVAGHEGLQVHSPSRVMYEIGVSAADGLRSGSESASMTGGDVRNFSRSDRSTVVHVDVGGLHFAAQIGNEDLIPLLESQVADIFERAALELGQ